MLFSNNDVLRRRSIRLKDYNYSQSGAYFVTIATSEKTFLFGDIQGDRMLLNSIGEIACECWKQISFHFNDVITDVFVVMPNHIHSIIFIDYEGSACRAPTESPILTNRSFLGIIIRSYKSAVTNQVHKVNKMQGITIWQRNYYEHVVRNDNDLNQIRQYILDNPVNWALDSDNSEYKPKFT
jgi:putative transposase